MLATINDYNTEWNILVLKNKNFELLSITPDKSIKKGYICYKQELDYLKWNRERIFEEAKKSSFKIWVNFLN